MMRTVVLKACGQASAGPIGVADQSKDRMRRGHHAVAGEYSRPAGCVNFFPTLMASLDLVAS